MLGCTSSLFCAKIEVVDDEEFNLIASTYLENPVEIHPLLDCETPNCPTPPEVTPEAQQAACAAGASNVNGYTINFENIQVVELIRFISQISNTNFIFDCNDVNFRISIVSEDPTSVENLMAALLQVLKMHELSVVEQGNNVLIYRNQTVSKVSTVITDNNIYEACGTSVITRVFRLYNIGPDKASNIVKPLLSKDAVVEQSMETRHLIVTDITANVDKIADLLTALDTPNETMDIAEYTVQSAFPAVLVAYAKEILGPLASDVNAIQLIPQPTSRKIFIVSTPYLINKAIQVLKSLDSSDITDVADLPASSMANNIFYVYKLKYQNGQDIASAIRGIGNNLQYLGVSNVDLINTIYSIEWIQVNNSLIITGTEDSVDKVVQLIDDLDVAPKQVYLEVLVIDTTLTNALDFGVQWVALANEQNKLAFASGLLNTPPAAAPIGSLGIQQNPLYGGARSASNTPPPDSARGGAPGTGGDVPLDVGFGLGIVGNIIRHGGESFLTLGALVSALEQESETTIVLNPRIMAEDFQQANLFVGSNIPYQTTNTIVRDTGSVTQNIQYEDIGVQLRITPTISPDNIVTLQIDQSISRQLTEINNLTPTTSKTLTSTRVHVPDGTFLVMSGHISDSKLVSRAGIPCLGTLPLIGPAFSTTNEARQKQNLIMFIRPHVISDIDEGLRLTNQEGYDYNWESYPGAIFECDTERAPENETYPPPACPRN